MPPIDPRDALLAALVRRVQRLQTAVIALYFVVGILIGIVVFPLVCLL